MDFTLTTYTSLLTTLLRQGYTFHPMDDLPFVNNDEKTLVLRHDVDRLPRNSLETAQIEHSLGLRCTYYFRIVPESNQADMIGQIRDLGHEIGYHYEDLTIAKGNKEKAYESFIKNLAYFRNFYPVKTICMHGSPLSKWDSRDIWKKYDYRTQGILCEPYFDIDFNKVLYLTDTGRRWDGWHVNVRDKIPEQNGRKTAYPSFRSTADIISAALQNELPPKIMMNIHPQRWTNKPIPWLKELVFQRVKNRVKYFVAGGREE